MTAKTRFRIEPQPNLETCGPTCLHAIYQHYGDSISLTRVTSEIPRARGGGTLAVWLGCHALARGYKATLYTYNLNVFDPSWFGDEGIDMRERLHSQMKHKRSSKLLWASRGYRRFLAWGGEILLRDLTPGLLRENLERSVPIISGLSSTYFYKTPRETADSHFDDIQGKPQGHFVVLYGFKPRGRKVLVADPLLPNPVADSQHYAMPIDRVICAVLLGILTYDANLLVIEPCASKKRSKTRD